MANNRFNKIGDKIFDLRKLKDISQDDFAKKVGVSRQTVIKWEANQTFPKSDKLHRICDVLDISMDLLISSENTLEEQVENDCEVVADVDVVSDEAIESHVEEIIPQPDNTKDKTTKHTKKRKKHKLSKKAKIAIIATVLSIVLLVGIIMIIASFIIEPSQHIGSFYATEMSTTWNLGIKNVGWILFGLSVTTVVILSIVLIYRTVRKKKINNKEENDVKS
ncbi:MAG: helix-turn-helix domain-containing protein [Clostridia bacterium]|nr:helix-turn-helix domain-containing protein [Clostridia bacterium]